MSGWTIDAALRHTQGAVTLGLSASKLFDKVTVVGNQFYSQGRVLKATVNHRW